jgi:hypothetical protein
LKRLLLYLSVETSFPEQQTICLSAPSFRLLYKDRLARNFAPLGMGSFVAEECRLECTHQQAGWGLTVERWP